MMMAPGMRKKNFTFGIGWGISVFLDGVAFLDDDFICFAHFYGLI